MKKVILTNGDFELTIVKGDVFGSHSDDQETVYLVSERNINDDTIKYCIVYDYFLDEYLSKFVTSSLTDMI